MFTSQTKAERILSGWNNNASIGTIVSYIGYWLSVIVALVYMKWSEGRLSLFGYKSAAWYRREDRRNRMVSGQNSPEIDEDTKKSMPADSPSQQATQSLYELPEH